MNVTKIKYTDGFRRILQAGVVNRLVVYCRASSKELVQLQSCVAALGNLADAFDISDVLLLEGMGASSSLTCACAAGSLRGSGGWGYSLEGGGWCG